MQVARRTIAYLGCVWVFCSACSREQDAQRQSAAAVQSAALQPALEPSPAVRMAEACVQSHEASRPVLLEFSADWCPDCKRLEALKQTSPLREELAHWHYVSFDADDERYDDLTDAFDVRAIARWVLLDPRDCGQPVTAWEKLADRVLEPTRNTSLSSESLAAWLAGERGKSHKLGQAVHDG